MATKQILTVDVGTSSTKPSLRTEVDQLVAHASFSNKLHHMVGFGSAAPKGELPSEFLFLPMNR